MTAKLAYDIIMTLPQKEFDILLNMLEPHFENFDIDTLLLDEIVNTSSKEEMTRYLIKTIFSKHKNS